MAERKRRLARLRERLRTGLRRELWLALGLPALLVVVAFVVAWTFVKPAPPSTLVVAVPKSEGGFPYFARRYKEILARHGVTLVAKEVEGSGPALALLLDGSAGVDAAFVQGGTPAPKPPGDAADAPAPSALASLTYTPLWVFHRGEPLDDFSALKGKTLSIGPVGSGTNALARTLLGAAGALGDGTTLVTLARDDAFKALLEGTIDAALVVAPADAPAIQKLAKNPGIQLLGLSRAEAYARRFTYLSHRVLPAGVLDLATARPSRDVPVLAPTADLVAGPSLHPALAYLLLRAASEVHGGAGLLDRANEFPQLRDDGFAPSDEARRYFTSGTPLLQRSLPFWLANLVDRLWVLLLPLVAVMLPLLRVVPALYRWRVRSRVYRWYAQLKELELELEDLPGHDKLLDMRARLDRIEDTVNHIAVPLAYAEHIFFFREHVDVVRRRITERLSASPAAAVAEEIGPA